MPDSTEIDPIVRFETAQALLADWSMILRGKAQHAEQSGDAAAGAALRAESRTISRQRDELRFGDTEAIEQVRDHYGPQVRAHFAHRQATRETIT